MRIMVEVHPADKAKTESLAKRAGVPMPVRAMNMSRAGDELGYVLYTIDRDTVEIIALYSEEQPLEELLVRAALNDAVNALAITAVCRNAAHFELLGRLGFADENGTYTIFIPDFFMRPCSGCSGA